MPDCKKFNPNSINWLWGLGKRKIANYPKFWGILIKVTPILVGISTTYPIKKPVSAWTIFGNIALQSLA